MNHQASLHLLVLTLLGLLVLLVLLVLSPVLALDFVYIDPLKIFATMVQALMGRLLDFLSIQLEK